MAYVKRIFGKCDDCGEYKEVVIQASGEFDFAVCDDCAADADDQARAVIEEEARIQTELMRAERMELIGYNGYPF